jgi:threonine dehydrogenase-like Zn-dependent dehydrogenase
MRALVFSRSIPRYLLLKALGSRFRTLPARGGAPLRLRDVPLPKLPTPKWVRVAPTLAGICGSDLATITAKGSAYLAPVTSMPFIMGHEVVGEVTEVGADVDRFKPGERVVIHPALGCAVRGIEPRCGPCRDRRDALCRNVTRGDIAPGIQTGYCRDTGGGFGESLVAHESQLYRVPGDIPDRAAVLIEPFACALHGVLRAKPAANEAALVIGCGSVGLLTIAALRATGCCGRIVAVAKYNHQREHAANLGADETLPAGGAIGDRYGRWAGALDAEVLRPEIGKPTVMGGADVTFDCVASSTTIDDGLRFTRSGGRFVLVGMPGVPKGVDWTPMWFKELTVHAAYAYGPERTSDGQKDTFEIAMDLMRTWSSRLTALVGTAYPLEQYREAFAAALSASRSGAVKTVFSLQRRGT